MLASVQQEGVEAAPAMLRKPIADDRTCDHYLPSYVLSLDSVVGTTRQMLEKSVHVHSISDMQMPPHNR